MESRQDHPPLTVEQAKTRLREVAVRCDPGTIISQHPWYSVAAAASAGLAAGQGGWLRNMALKGAVAGLRYLMQGPSKASEDKP